jgi:hypothetical protein
MKRIFLLIPAIFALLVISSCKKSDIASGTPKCIRDEITTRKNDPQWLVSKISEYLFQDKLVYGFEQRSVADAAMEVKDESCNTLCFVGGFGGPSVNFCHGDNFFQTSVLKRIIWERK